MIVWAQRWVMYAVHVVASQMDPAEYAVFAALLKVFLLMSFPAIGLQVIFTQQAAAALAESEQRTVAAAARSAMRGTFVLWAAMAVLAIIWRRPIIASLKISNPAALWIDRTRPPRLVAGPALPRCQNSAWAGWRLSISGAVLGAAFAVQGGGRRR
jgi:hypothetical protein